mmetsp:Transcript_7125/g.19088  ORF Transcript_7125/g.19088 Transcript_7125/m.19088 type:complete len:342 (+) Transcript_7125:368-1393(+)
MQRQSVVGHARGHAKHKRNVPHVAKGIVRVHGLRCSVVHQHRPEVNARRVRDDQLGSGGYAGVDIVLEEVFKSLRLCQCRLPGQIRQNIFVPLSPVQLCIGIARVHAADARCMERMHIGNSLNIFPATCERRNLRHYRGGKLNAIDHQKLPISQPNQRRMRPHINHAEDFEASANVVKPFSDLLHRSARTASALLLHTLLLSRAPLALPPLFMYRRLCIEVQTRLTPRTWKLERNRWSDEPRPYLVRCVPSEDDMRELGKNAAERQGQWRSPQWGLRQLRFRRAENGCCPERRKRAGNVDARRGAGARCEARRGDADRRVAKRAVRVLPDCEAYGPRAGGA